MRTTAFARLVGLGLLALVLCAGSVAAQATTGSIQGVVTDSQGRQFLAPRSRSATSIPM